MKDKPTPPQAETTIKGAGEKKEEWQTLSTLDLLKAMVKQIMESNLVLAPYAQAGKQYCPACYCDPNVGHFNHCALVASQKHIAAQREDVSGEKPAVFYCENGKSLEGLEQGALAVLSNLMMKTNATNAEFMIGNEKDGEFYFTCSRTKPTPAPIGAEVGEALADVELCMRDYAYDPLLGRKLRKHLKTIRAALKKGGV